MNESTVLANPQPMSSIELKQSATGKTAVTVKVYAATVEEAAALATAQYDTLTQRYARAGGEG